MTIVW